MQKRRQHANHLQHIMILRLADSEEERLHDNAVESEPSMSATPSPSPPFLPPPSLPQPFLPPRTVRLLTMDNQQADSPLLRSPSPERAASPVVEEAPASPIVHCSQYRMEEYERQNGPLPGHDKVDGWLRDIQAVYESDGPSFYPTQPAAPRKDRYVSDSDLEHGPQRRRRRRSLPATRIKNAEICMHKDSDFDPASKRTAYTTVTRASTVSSTCQTYYGQPE